MIYTPTSIQLQAQAKIAAYEAEASRERLLRQEGAPSALRKGIASVLYGLAKRLAPDFNYPSPTQGAHPH
jgi:hypothetical protein